ncbi:MAG TPA: AbrB/MazE/SpoVT family DNA-binding domain-containing protein [Armatimonadota bacterium]|nr:AbrB/MazE/SpoVT family DNA-binding domain-containing protein [Armatimonadota bacterium]
MTPKPLLEECFLGTVTVGERGQVVIPAEARKKLEIHTGDKLFMMSHPSGDGLVVFKIDAMREFLNHLAAGLSIAEGQEAELAHALEVNRSAGGAEGED